jgi:lipopolysaccharide/colanic/teichoic acid biosynthesis glycosyltransferase/RimJ/RimL family protein N-acetyltransferase
VKRAIDSVLVLLAAPAGLVLWIIAALGIRITMGRPVIFQQPRIGLNEREFRVLKFRTMRDAHDVRGRPLPDRDRLTAWGRLLRKTSLDELPQLLNVLRGDMSLVGPRPLLPEYVPFYRESERARHTVRPGITGAAQVAGRNAVLWDERLRLDAKYAREGNLRDDAIILAKTIKSVFRSSGVSIIAGDSGEPLHIARGYPVREGLTMRRLEYIDVPTRVRWFADPRIQRTMNVPRDATVERTEAWLRQSRKDPGKRDYVLVAQNTGDVLAMMGTRRQGESPTVEIYVAVDPDRHGRGLGAIATGLLLEHIRRTPELRGAWLTVDPENAAAIRLYERLGFAVVEDQGVSNRMRMELWW